MYISCTVEPLYSRYLWDSNVLFVIKNSPLLRRINAVKTSDSPLRILSVLVGYIVYKHVRYEEAPLKSKINKIPEKKCE